MLTPIVPKFVTENPNTEFEPAFNAILEEFQESETSDTKDPSNLEALPNNAVEEICQEIRNEVQKTENPYHDLPHSDKVAFIRLTPLIRNLKEEFQLSERQIQIAIISALGHDLGHPGTRYRQADPKDIPGKNMSNEEWAVLVVSEIVRGTLRSSDLIQIRDLILPTSFGQGPDAIMAAFPADTTTQEKLIRHYRPTTPTQFLLTFADIAGFMDPEGAEGIIRNTQNVVLENTGENITRTAAIKNAIGFMENFVTQKLKQIEKYLKEDYYNQLVERFQQTLTELKSLDSGE